jgi:hypothetical protein
LNDRWSYFVHRHAAPAIRFAASFLAFLIFSMQHGKLKLLET